MEIAQAIDVLGIDHLMKSGSLQNASDFIGDAGLVHCCFPVQIVNECGSTP